MPAPSAGNSRPRRRTSLRRCRRRIGQTPSAVGAFGAAGSYVRPEPEEPAERGTHREAEPLQPGRRERQPHVVEVMLRDHREPQRVRHPALRDLAVGGKREHRLDELLEAEGGRHLADEVGRLLADVAEAVRRSRRAPARGRPVARRSSRSRAGTRACPASTSKRSSWDGCTCAAATAPSGSTNASTTTDSPFVSAEVVRKTSVSPVTGFVSDCPVVIISAS